MKREFFLIMVCFSSVLSSLLLTFNINAQECDITYPTLWYIKNPHPIDMHLECRVYHGGWSYQNARDLSFSVAANQRFTYEFPDHNDSLGMLQRGWSCAVGNQEMPLMQSNSVAFPFEGCPEMTMTLPNPELLHSSTPSAPVLTSSTSFSYCPSPQSIKRRYVCREENCSWDQYASGTQWLGDGNVLSREEMSRLQFKGADAGLDGKAMLGCVYYSEGSSKPLILLSYLESRPDSGTYPEFRFKPARQKDFNKVSGNLRQCLASQPSSCPLLPLSSP